MYGYQERKGGRMDWEIGIGIYTLLCIKSITNENQLYSTGNSTQHCRDPNGKEIQGRVDIRIHVVDALCCAQHCRTTILPFKKIKPGLPTITWVGPIQSIEDPNRLKDWPPYASGSLPAHCLQTSSTPPTLLGLQALSHTGGLHMQPPQLW